jgi:hypothetical protein
MNGDSRPLLADEPVEVREINRFTFKTSGRLIAGPFFEEFTEYSSINLRKKKPKDGCQHVTGWSWKH